MTLELVGILPAGSYTTEDTMRVMSQYAQQDAHKPEIQSLAEHITQGLNPNDPQSIMLAIRNWILSNLKYVTDSSEAVRLYGNKMFEHMEHGELEAVKNPVSTLVSGRYDCDCAASLIAALLISLGISVRFMAVGFVDESVSGPDDGFSHVFAQGFDGQNWIVIDPVSYPYEKAMIARDTKQIKIVEVG